MPKYYVNKNAQPTGEHEVHADTCPHKPLMENTLCLGEYPSCHGAVLKASLYYDEVDGCGHCCGEGHAR